MQKEKEVKLLQMNGPPADLEQAIADLINSGWKVETTTGATIIFTKEKGGGPQQLNEG